MQVSNSTLDELYNDICTMVAQIKTGACRTLDSDKMVLAVSPALRRTLNVTNSSGFTTEELIQKNFPNIRIKDAVNAS